MKISVPFFQCWSLFLLIFFMQDAAVRPVYSEPLPQNTSTFSSAANPFDPDADSQGLDLNQVKINYIFDKLGNAIQSEPLAVQVSGIKMLNGNGDGETDENCDFFCKMTGRYVEAVAAYIESQFPEFKPMPKSGNPLGNLVRFFQGAEMRNSLCIGHLFKLGMDFFPLRKKRLYEIRQERTVTGYKNDKIIYRNAVAFEGNELVSQEMIINDFLMRKYKKQKSFSFLHDLPDQFRRDGIDDTIIGLTQEIVNLVNYHLWKNHNERGLDIPVNHPQLKLPEGYTPDIFRRNFTYWLYAMYYGEPKDWGPETGGSSEQIPNYNLAIESSVGLNVD